MVANLGLFRYVFGIAVGISILALLSGNGASAATIIVPHDFIKIQWAIDNATSGDTIIVQSGTYYENVNINKKLIIKGIGMPVVDARGKGSTIKLSKNGIRLEGFIAIGAGSRIENAGIKVKTNNNILIGNNATKNGNGDIFGTGIYLYYSNNNTLKNNNASDNNPGGKYRHGIILESSDNNMLIHNKVSDNEYGIFLLYSSNNTLNGNNISNNIFGIFLSNSNNNTLIRNNLLKNQLDFSLYHSNNNAIEDKKKKQL
jgi:parallel beta-helix repeat protein